jgi:hypothetical protein
VRALAANDRDLRLVDLLETQHVAAHPLPPLCVLESMSQRFTGPPSYSRNGSRARADEVLAGASLDNGNVDPRQRQLARQHQPRRTSSGDHHRMLGHSHTPAGITPVATSAPHPSATAATVSN